MQQKWNTGYQKKSGTNLSHTLKFKMNTLLYYFVIPYHHLFYQDFLSVLLLQDMHILLQALQYL